MISFGTGAIISTNMIEHDINIRIKRTLDGAPAKAWFNKVLCDVINLMGPDGLVECGLLITDDRDIRKLNAKYRKIDRPTDVLSFTNATEHEADVPFVQPPDGICHLGEIIISFDQVQEQARQDNKTIETVFVMLIVHGLLHLMGYDHEADEEAEAMEAKEAEIIEALNRSLENQSGR